MQIITAIAVNDQITNGGVRYTILGMDSREVLVRSSFGTEHLITFATALRWADAAKTTANLITAYDNLARLVAMGADTTRQLRIIARLEAQATNADI